MYALRSMRSLAGLQTDVEDLLLIRFTQAFPRRMLVRCRLVMETGAHVSSNVFTSRAGMHSEVTDGRPFSDYFPNALRRRLVAAPLPLPEAALRQPLRRYQGPCQ